MQTSLVIDTVSPVPGVSIFRNDVEIVSWVCEDETEKMSEVFLNQMNYLLENQRLSIYDLSRIICVVGPGSLTGVRVGVSIAKGLSFGLSHYGIRVEEIGVTLLSALAAVGFVASNESFVRSVVFFGNKAIFQDFQREDDGFREIGELQFGDYVNTSFAIVSTKNVKEILYFIKSNFTRFVFTASKFARRELRPFYYVSSSSLFRRY
ncbi:MAG: tRNA (adenosine(37)-N6)-threonylcarbamoyltransferase complex dimerization subunit type 1 TsaB [Pyrinomonadaceae bacterium]|nr:tRNA (adenosine(37)-N6)-threonylcarbamoyltransferase complex dimerization subunit type 1 TsaB [Pyrinomonadaceae bacterium]MCX7641002.1 tRNA (adenosine(37)-N6)-threonylcarbamoyltransferase complex dimerization subunit type 1 TsaB [Pyrinomonadaceae bacterium]MDW8305074.1 tRNA (adenosine(37)-N6)-threonylcarbamoyltransferase complex dimerization subunit type 1 TsaB [Acidobacteriota bacterium]